MGGDADSRKTYFVLLISKRGKKERPEIACNINSQDDSKGERRKMGSQITSQPKKDRKRITRHLQGVQQASENSKGK